MPDFATPLITAAAHEAGYRVFRVFKVFRVSGMFSSRALFNIIRRVVKSSVVSAAQHVTHRASPSAAG